MTSFQIEGGAALEGRIRPSGNKNESLPCIAACLLSDKPIVLNRVPKIQDVLTLCEILGQMGVDIRWQSEEQLYLCAKNAVYKVPDARLCAKIRASILLLGPMLARFGRIELALPGGDVIGARRIDTHFEGIAALGGKLEFGNPIKASIDKIEGKDIFLDEPSVTATENVILLAARCQGETIIHNAASEPHVVGLCELLQEMGVHIRGIGSNRLSIEGCADFKQASHSISSDFMEVGSLICLGAISEGEITIEDIEPDKLRFILKTFAKMGIDTFIEGNNIKVQNPSLHLRKDIGGRIGTIYSGPWPAFPTDLMSVAIVTATQGRGTMIFHEKMFEARMFFTDNLMQMGADIVLCDPHRVVITGPNKLKAATMSSPDVRAGMALLMAALIAKGTSHIHNIYQIERGYANICEKLQGLGAKIKRCD